MRHTVIRALALTAVFTQSVCAAALPGKGVVVKPVQSSLAEESFQTELVNRALQKLGYDVQPTNEVDYNVAYTAIGDATYLAVNWKPQMEEMYDHAGGDGKFYRRGTYIAGAAQGYLIDKKTAEKYHIRTLDQLRDPALAKLFDTDTDTDGDGKADITGCNPGWICGNVIDGHIKAFNLQSTVTQNQGNYSAIHRRYTCPLSPGQAGALLHLDALLAERRTGARPGCGLATGPAIRLSGQSGYPFA